MTKAIIVSTSAPELAGHKTGLWLEECAAPYYKFKEAGYEIDIASPAGGPVPLDSGSLQEMFLTDACKKFLFDPEAMGMLSHTSKLSDVDLSAADAIFFCGGHGTCVDFIDDASVKGAIETLYGADKVVAAVCHGPNCLPQCVKPGSTDPLVKGLTVTGFTDTEESAVQLASKVPFLLEQKLKEQGCIFERADDWNSKVCIDGKLVTGQNPQSSEACAEAVIKIILSA
uniref:DJ-1/PfpI domain-containing protein n=1 Tax=Odontella aurita TaxID=265563 RepID=A0A7S4I150_9STRA|mmetsp:Transcript_18437/g.53161  ORF Transcript_18437/g.53161 Transcript_18437/m.53161 type:complete len:228 (+) Transcript_18437:51-734(+)